MTGTERIRNDVKKYMVAIIMMVVLCGFALAGRAQISKLEESGQITVEKTEDEETSEDQDKQEDDKTAEKLPSPPSEKIKPVKAD